MPENVYTLVAQGARYWFLFLMALIVWRSWRWYRIDKRKAKKRLRLLPDAGYVGELTVVKGTQNVPEGDVFPVPAEGSLGAHRMSDVYLPDVARTHAWLRFEDGRGLWVDAVKPVTVDGAPSGQKPQLMLHGSVLAVGMVELRLSLFKGYESAGVARPREPEAELMDRAKPVPEPIPAPDLMDRAKPVPEPIPAPDLMDRAKPVPVSVSMPVQVSKPADDFEFVTDEDPIALSAQASPCPKGGDDA